VIVNSLGRGTGVRSGLSIVQLRAIAEVERVDDRDRGETETCGVSHRAVDPNQKRHLYNSSIL
jgi:hypothetical protein